MLSPVVLVFILCFVYLWLKYGRIRPSSHPLPPAVPGKLPIVGHGYLLLQYFNNLLDLVKFVSEDCEKKGGVTYFNFGRELYYLISDPEDALKASNLCTQKHYVFDFGKDWIGHGLLISSGEVWKRHRKLLTPAFSLPVVYRFLDVFNSQSKKLASSVEAHVGKGPFDQFPFLKINSLETLCISTLGINFDDVDFMQRYMENVELIIKLALARGVKFWLQSDFIYRLVGLEKKKEEVLENLNAMYNAVLKKKKAAMIHGASSAHIEDDKDIMGKKYKPFLDLILDLAQNGVLTEKEIRDEINTVIAAGYETTSSQLTSIFFLIGAHPDVQEKIYQELLEVLGPHRDVEKDDVNKLIYTNAVLMECLRMYPSVPILFRSVLQDSKLKNYTMRAGSHCVIFPLATHRDSAWGAESDKFRPERWLNGDLFNNKEFAAFSLGKRACVGRTYATISMKVTLAHFLRQYRVKADVSKLKMTYDYLLKPVSGHEISLERRT